MLTKMIGALVGGKMAQNAKDISGPTGAAIGAAVPFIVSRLSIPAMIAMGVGGYAVKKYMDRKEQSTVDVPPSTSKAPKLSAEVPEHA